jgi:hypothetical protein
VKRSRHRQQPLPNQVKKEPGSQQTQSALAHAQHSGESSPLQQWHPRQLAQASRANHPVIVLGDALAAKKLPARRATRHRFPLGMIETALVD